MKKITAYFDGCCEPINPGGTAAFGAVIMMDGKTILQHSEIYKPLRPRETSNNVAEYNGLLAILEFLYRNKLNEEQIVIRGDSQLVIRQMSGEWGINQGLYVPFANRARNALRFFPNIRFEWVSRESNRHADGLSKRHLKRAGIKFRIQPE